MNGPAKLQHWKRGVTKRINGTVKSDGVHGFYKQPEEGGAGPPAVCQKKVLFPAGKKISAFRTRDVKALLVDPNPTYGTSGNGPMEMLRSWCDFKYEPMTSPSRLERQNFFVKRPSDWKCSNGMDAHGP